MLTCVTFLIFAYKEKNCLFDYKKSNLNSRERLAFKKIIRQIFLVFYITYKFCTETGSENFKLENLNIIVAAGRGL